MDFFLGFLLKIWILKPVSLLPHGNNHLEVGVVIDSVVSEILMEMYWNHDELLLDFFNSIQ